MLATRVVCAVGRRETGKGRQPVKAALWSQALHLYTGPLSQRGTLEKASEVSGQEMRDGVYLHTSNSLVKGRACGGVNSQIIVVYCLQAYGSGSSRTHYDSLESAGY